MTSFHAGLRALALFATLSVMPAAGMAIEIQTAAGPATVEAMPKTIAVFDIAAIDTLDRLGVKPAGVPNTIYLKELGHVAAGAEVVGTLFEPDLEALSALGPDLVIVGGRSQPKAAAVRQLAPTVDMTIEGHNLLDDALKRLEDYGALFGKQREAAEARAELEAALAKARASVLGKGKALIVMTNGSKVSVFGPGSRFGWLHSALDLPPVVEDLENAIHGETISFEFIAKVNPDWLIVVDRAAAISSNDQSARVTLDNQLVVRTTAWQKNQVVYLPAADFYIAAGGAQATLRLLNSLTQAFGKS